MLILLSLAFNIERARISFLLRLFIFAFFFLLARNVSGLAMSISDVGDWRVRPKLNTNINQALNIEIIIRRYFRILSQAPRPDLRQKSEGKIKANETRTCSTSSTMNDEWFFLFFVKRVSRYDFNMLQDMKCCAVDCEWRHDFTLDYATIVFYLELYFSTESLVSFLATIRY